MEAHVYALTLGEFRFYVGSTRETIHSRLMRHRRRATTNERPHSVVHQYMRECGPSNIDVELIASVPLADRVRTEAEFIRRFGVLNQQVPGRTQAQRRAESRAARAFLETLDLSTLAPSVA